MEETGVVMEGKWGGSFTMSRDMFGMLISRTRCKDTYRAEKKSWQILLSSTQAGPGREVKQEQE